MQFVMLSEIINSSLTPSHPPQGSLLCLHPTAGGSGPLQPAPTCTGWKHRGQVPLQLPRSRPGAQVQITPHQGRRQLQSSTPSPRGQVRCQRSRAVVLRGEWRELGAGFLAGDLCGRTETVRVSFPRATGARGRGVGVQGSSVHHRTKNRMSTTSKMTKRTIIAHHCRRSGRKRKRQPSCFNGEGKSGESFSLLYC